MRFSKPIPPRGFATLPLLFLLFTVASIFYFNWRELALSAQAGHITNLRAEQQRTNHATLAQKLDLLPASGAPLQHPGWYTITAERNGINSKLILRYNPALRPILRWSALLNNSNFEPTPCSNPVTPSNPSPFVAAQSCSFADLEIPTSKTYGTNISASVLGILLSPNLRNPSSGIIEHELRLTILGDLEVEDLAVSANNATDTMNDLTIYAVGDINIGKLTFLAEPRANIRLMFHSAHGVIRLKTAVPPAHFCTPESNIRLTLESNSAIYNGTTRLSGPSIGCPISHPPVYWDLLRIVGYH